jgi:prepilin-type processing-associated H-X9-DG protein
VAISVTCLCGKTFETGEAHAGRRVHCPGCDALIYVPHPQPFVIGEPRRGPRPVAWRTLALVVAALAVGLLILFVGSEVETTRSSMATMRSAASETRCLNNLKLIGQALAQYESEHGRFPPPVLTDAEGKPLLSWRVAILPYLGEAELYARFHRDEPWDSSRNASLLAAMPACFACPESPPQWSRKTVYQAVVGPHTMFPDDRDGVARAEVIDGTAVTIHVVETNRPVEWTAPEDTCANRCPVELTECHGGRGFNFVYADGTVRASGGYVPQPTLQALLSRDGGENVTAP